MRRLAAIPLLALLPAVAAGAPRLSLNGVPIDGVVGQRIENATVVIDDRGDVHILARGYAVEGPGAPAPPAATPAPPPPGPRPAAPPEGRAAPAAAGLSRRYFVVARQTSPGATGYDVAVFLNGRWVREVRSDGDAEPFEVTRFLQPGPNRVQLVATKRPEGAGRGGSRDSTLRVAIGEGSVAGGPVLLDAPLVEMTRSAAETETFTEEHTLVAR